MEYKASGIAQVAPGGGIAGADDWTIRGIASPFLEVDLIKDEVMPGSYARSLKQRPQVHILWQHEVSEPVGMTNLLFESDDVGLLFKGELVPTRRGTDARLLARKGILAVSIGYNAKQVGYATVNGERVRQLKEIDLVEISLVTFPAAPGARLLNDLGRIKDLITIADFEQKSAAGAWQPPKAHLGYLDAMKREWERKDNGGQTDREAAYHRAYQIQEAMRELGV